MNMEFRDAISSFRATPWRKSIGILETAARRIKSAGRPLSSVRSYSSRKPAPPVLAHGERLFSAFMDNLPGFAWMKDIEGHYLHVNKRLEQLTPYQTGWLGKTDADLWPDEIAAIFRGTDRKVIATSKTLETVESYMVDGEHRHVWVSKFPIFDGAGAVVMVGGSSVDITARRQAVEALRESEDRYQDLVEHSHDMIYTHDLEGRVLFANQTGTQLLGLAPSEVVGRELTEFLVPEVRDQFAAYLEEIRARGMANGLMLVQTSTGERRVCEYSNTLRAEGTGGPIVRCIARDVTERKRTEKALQESEERFRQLSEAAFEAIILHDNGTILEVNQSFCRMYGYERAEVIGKSVLDLALPEFRELLLQKVRSGDTGPYESPALRKDGTIFKAEVAGKPINYQGRVVRVGAIRDITEQKRNERRQAAQYAVTRVLAESATLAEAIPQLLQVICESLRWKMGEFWRACDSTNLLRCVETWHVPALDATAFIEASRQTELAPGVGLPGRVWQSGQPAWIPDVMTDPRFARAAIAAKVGLRGAVAFPILLGNHTLGVMLFFSRRAPEADEDLLKMMSAMGSQIGQFIERKRAEEALLASERKYRDIFTFAPVGIYQSLRDGTLITANEALAEMLGYASVDELLKVKLGSGMYLSEDKREGLIREQEVPGYPIDRELQWKTKDGSPIWIQLNAHAIKGANGVTEYWEGFVRDITARKLAEEALREAVQKYRDIFENAGEGIFQSTPDGRFLSANPALARIHGYESPEEMIRRLTDISTQIYVDSKRRDEFRHLLAEQGIVRGFEHQVFRKDGGKIWISVNARAVRDNEGAIRYYEGTAQDITDRKQAEDELIKQKEILQQIVDHIPVMINFTDSDGRIRLVNREWQQTLGWSLEEILNEDLDVFAECYPDPRYRQQVLSLVTTATGDWGDFKTRRRDGSMIDTSWFRVKLSDGTTIGIGQDITARKRAEQALRQAEQKYRELFENAKDATYVHDLSGRYTSMNRAAEKLLGYSREEILGKNFSSFVAPEYAENVRENLSKKLWQEGETTYEVEVITKDGRRVPVKVSSRLIYEEGVPVAVQGTARNISERKRAEEALRGYSRQLIRAQEAERQSIARELHDQIGQVLTAIRINLETIRDSSNQAESKALIDEGVTIVDEAIQQVRDLSFELRPSLLDDLGLTAALRWYADRYAQRTGIQTKTSICPESRIRLPRELETACFRIVQEALTNVARHAHAKNVSIDVRTMNGSLSLSIKDDGIGFNLHSQTNGELLSSLGFRGMEERAHGLGGKLEIKSAPYEGTEVTVHFPNRTKRKN